MKYQGSCHCGRIVFQAEGDLGEVLACNCSMCQRKGSLLWFVPRTRFELLAGAEGMGKYTFNTHAIEHRFCPDCGIHPFAEAIGPDGQPVAAINARCLEEVDLGSLQVRHYDGRAI